MPEVMSVERISLSPSICSSPNGSCNNICHLVNIIVIIIMVMMIVESLFLIIALFMSKTVHKVYFMVSCKLFGTFKFIDVNSILL